MPRRLLRDGLIVVDDWHYAAPELEPTAWDDASIVPYERWLSARQAQLAPGLRLGVLLEPDQPVEPLAADCERLKLVALRFPSFSEGRGYSQARLLRERWKFRGELRAVGHVRRDLLFFMARCGCNAFELPDAEFEAAATALHAFTAGYQATNDLGLPSALRHR
jgi:uncharacterized protein (DUF934 family)